MLNELSSASSDLPTQPASTDGMFSAAQLQAPEPSPAPVKYTPTPDELASAVPATPEPIKYTPTPQELASAKPVAPNIFEAMTPEQMVAEAKAQPKSFDPVAAFQSLPSDEQMKNLDKAAETFHQLRTSGHYVPGVMDMLRNAGKGIVDLAKTGQTYGQFGVNALLGDASQGTDTFRGALGAEAKQQAAELASGQVMAGLGLGQMLTKGAEWAARGLHITKPLADYTPEDKLAALGAELATRNGMARLAQGSLSPENAADLAKQGFGIRPEKVEEAASGSPFAWEGAGKIFGAATGATGLAARAAISRLPEGVQAAVASLPQAASDLTSAAVGKTIQGVGKAGELVSAGAEKVLPPLIKVGAPVAAIGKMAAEGPSLESVIIAREALNHGSEWAEKAERLAGRAGVGFEKLGDMGKQIATGKDITSSAAQLGRDVTQAAPGALANTAAGAAADVGIQQTQETPAEQASFTPFGTILGGASALKGMGKRVVSGQIIGPRAWGSPSAPARPESFARNFPGLDQVHNESMADAPPGVQQRFNAIQKFVEGAAPGTQVVYAPRPEEGQADPLPQVLHESGMDLSIADQDGAYQRAIGQDGQAHGIVVVRDLEAAPHESRHAMDDVLGASAVRQLNADAKQGYGPERWNTFKQAYADRLTPTGLPTSDPDGTILRETGAGNGAAKEKITSQARAALPPGTPESTVVAEAGKAITDLQNQAQSEGKDLWEHVLTPTEQSDAVDQYVGGEVRAEHHDAWFKAGRPGEARGKMTMAAARVLSALGINPVEGRNTDYEAPLEGSLVTQAQKTSPQVDINPVGAAEGTHEAHQEAIQNANKAAQEASNHPLTGANKSPKEALGVIAEAIARKQGVKIDGLFAPEEPAASLSSNRDVRRQMIETYRTMPDAAKKLWGKLFFPQNVPVTARGGNLQVFGWSPEVFAANAHKTAEALNSLADKGSNISPYELDPVTKSFTEKGWHELYDDVQKYVANQEGGRTGSGEPLVVPESVTKAGAATPPVRGDARPLPQERADFINSLFNAKLPDTGLARQGAIGLPLNKAGQLISAATMPGRVEVPVRPRENFRGKVAVAQGVKGEPIMEVNPFRNRLEAELQKNGIGLPSLLEVNQRLNLKSIKDVNLAPEQGKFGANTLTLQAGFQPPKSPKEFSDFLDNSTPGDYENAVHGYSGNLGGGQTGMSFDAGAAVTSPDEVARLHSQQQKFSDMVKASLANKDYNSAMHFASKAQAAREAYEIAEGGPSAQFLKSRNPDFRAPLEGQVKRPNGVSANPMNDRETGASFQPPKDRIKNPEAEEVAKQYAKDHGFPEPVLPKNRPLPLDFIKDMADYLEDHEHAPNDPAVQKSYNAMFNEILEQAKPILKSIDVEPWPNKGEPYTSSRAMVEDVKNNKHLYFLPTDTEFGAAGGLKAAPEDIQNNLLVKPSGITLHGKELNVNEVLRFVHDYYGHNPEGNEFGPRGEYNALLTHYQMFSQEAKKALMSELLMQSSWYFAGRHMRRPDGSIPVRGDADFVPFENRSFADPKNLLPSDELVNKLDREVEAVRSGSAPTFQPKGREEEFEPNHVANMVEMWTRNGESARAIADRLNSEGFKDTNGDPFTKDSIKTLRQGQGMKFFPGEPTGTGGAFQPKKNEKEIELRHWSNVPGLKVLDPAFHGTGLTGEERARARDYKEIYIPRTYFGTKDYSKEGNLGPEQYRAFVKSKNLYPFQEDPKDLYPSSAEVEKSGYAPMDSKAANTLYENKISKAGYEGYIHRDANVAAKFTKTPVEHLGREGDARFQPMRAGNDDETAIRTAKNFWVTSGGDTVLAWSGHEESAKDDGLLPKDWKPKSPERDIHEVYQKARELGHVRGVLKSVPDTLYLNGKPWGQLSTATQAEIKRLSNKMEIPANYNGRPIEGAVQEPSDVTRFQPSNSPRSIKEAAVIDDDGNIYTGKWHGEATMKYLLAQGKSNTEALRGAFNTHPNLEDGFVTNEGEFLPRDQAFDRAVEQGQYVPGPKEHRWLESSALQQQERMVRLGYDPKVKYQPPLPAPKPEEFAHEDTIETALAKPNWMILSGTQEAQGPHDSPQNIKNNEDLYQELVKAGHTPIEVSGSYKGVDQGRNFLVTSISPHEADMWGKRFNQESVLTPHGLLYADGSVQPFDASKTKIGKAAEKEDFFSRVENGPAFSFGLDEKSKPQQAEQLLGEELGTARPLSSKQVGDMTKAQLAAHYPESVVPRKSDEAIDSNIEGSPLAKEAGSRPAAIQAFSDKLVNFAKSMEKTPGYQAGLKWYSEFVPKLKKVFGKHAPMMAELLAATSPNNAPDTNFGFANDALEGYVSGRFDKLISKFNEGLEKMKDGSWEKWLEKNGKNLPAKPSPATFLDQWITKHELNPRQSNGALYGMHSVPVLKVFARKWLENTSGPKTQNFVQNLLGTGHGATIDVWADRTMRRLGYADHRARWRILPKNGTGVSDSDFAFSQEAFKHAADRLGIDADALQGGLWFAEKQLWADNGWGRLDLGDYRKEIAKVDLMKSGIAQRLAVQKAKAKATKMEQPDLMDLVTPRK